MPSNSPVAIEPEFLGPLSDRPLASLSKSGAADLLFPGASSFFNARHQSRRLDQMNTVWPLASRLLQKDERVLHVSHAIQIPPTLQLLAMGAMAFHYHQVVMILTDKRIIEVLLGFRGKKAGTRIRSFPWTSVREMKLRFSKLVMYPAQGKKQSWKVPLGGDRKLLKLLLQRLKTKWLEQGVSAARRMPQFHCPACGHTLNAAAASCDSCRAAFRSPKLASALSLAFPGAGLLYAGHPFLALGDFLGEVILYGVFLLLMLEAEPGSVMIAAGLGAFFFIMTKLESIHISHILTTRTSPETPQRRSRYSRLAMAGGIASIIVIGMAFPLAGATRPVVDRDLDVSGADSLWEGTRDQAEWAAFEDDATGRSQWSNPDGSLVTLFAYPRSVFDDSTKEFRDSVRQGFLEQGMTILTEDEDVPAPFNGFRLLMTAETEEGETIAQAHYFILDEQNNDIHHVLTVATGDSTDPDGLARDLLSHAHWIDAEAPARLTAQQPAPAE